MPCERPGITPIDDSCCFSCYMEGRGPYQTPVAIVLHEVDYHLEALNNKLENCCNNDHDECHQSFHYGVGDDGDIINWVDPANTAWAFDPDTSDTNCGICGWSIATQEGTTVDPNLYTINIAVAGGVSSIVSGQTYSNNAYSQRQYDCLVRLVGWLAETYGITVTQNTVWRHCNELDDFPEGCACPPNRFDEFLTDVQACIDGETSFLPWLCDAMCDAPVLPGDPVYVFGADASCDECGRYQIGPTTQENFCTLMANALTPLVPSVVPGTMLVAADCSSAPMPDFCGLLTTSTVQTGAVVTDTSVTFLGNDCMWHAINQTEVDLCAEIIAHFTTDAGEAVPGQTNLLGLDCNYYQMPDVPDFCSLLFAATNVFDETLGLVLLQRNVAGDECRAVLLDTECTDTEFIHQTLGVARGGELKLGRAMASLPVTTIVTSDILDPSSDGLVIIDASNGNITLTLAAPTGCEPNMFMIKRLDNSQNIVTVNGGGNTIDGVASFTLDNPHGVSGAAGEAITVVWSGTNWVVI